MEQELSLPALTRHKKILVGFLILAAILLRLNYAYHSPVITRDGVGYVQWAKTGLTNFKALLTSPDQEPLYPLILGVTAKIITPFTSNEAPRYMSAAWILGTLCSLIAAWGVFQVGKTLLDADAGWLGAFLVVFIPELAALSSNVMTEPLFLACLTLSTVCLLAGMRQGWGQALWMSFLCAFFLFLAFMTRKEGMIALPIFVIFLLLPGLPRSLTQRTFMIVVLISTCGVGLGGYVLMGGRMDWIITYETIWKASKFLVFVVPSGDEPGLSNRPVFLVAKTLQNWRNFAWEPFHRWIKLCPGSIGLAALAYFPCHNKHKIPKPAWLLLGLITAYLAVVYLHSIRVGYFVGRYLMPAVLFSMPLAAVVIVKIARYVFERTQENLHWTPRKGRILAGAAVAIFLIPPLIEGGVQHTGDDYILLEACRWIKQNTKPTACVSSFDKRVSFYSERRDLPLGFWTFAQEYSPHSGPYSQVALFVFYQVRREEWIKDEILKTIRGKKGTEPKLLKRFSVPGFHDVLIYQGERAGG